MSGLRTALAVLSLWLPAAAILITWALWNDQLPSELPTHWGASGPADAATTATAYLGWLLVVAAGAALVGTVLLLIQMKRKWTQRAIGGVAAAVGAYALSMWLMSAAPALGVTDPYTVELGAWSVPSWIAPFYALVPLLLLPSVGGPPVAVNEPVQVEPLTLAPAQTAAWSRTVSSWLFISMTIVVFVLGVVIFAPLIASEGIGPVAWTLIPYLAAFLLVAVFCAFRVTVDWRGFRVTSLLLGIPLKRIAPENFASVEAATLEPTQWGGWGYRIMPGRSAIILRRGPGLVITQTDDKQFAITLDRPEEPASILLNLISLVKKASV
ncbi:hypothetical protein ACSS7Z_04390 [Microbacterium sp. A82]|uniref:hypothetical protein n=1 Tax=Microbacterium sp. A82 TaxID=3450452 RepID=UPI003F3231C6